MVTTSYILPIFLVFLCLADAYLKPNRRVTLQLVHRFSPSLPFHKSDNLLNFLERNDEHVMIKIATLQQQESIDVQLIIPTSAMQHLFFVNLSIGEPPVRQYLAMDTGSRLTWVIGDSLRREFNYSSHRSSTSGYIKCHSDTCKKIMKTFCNSNDKCMHYTSYADGNHGLQTCIAYDRFVFENDVLDKVIMDIYYKGRGRLFHEDNFYGIFGLSPPYPSFVHRLGDLGAKKFTYYINGKVTDTFHPYARLILGDADIQNGLTTPLHIDGAQYHLDMECIILGEQCLAIDRKIFAKKAHGGGTGVIIDTGSIFTYVAKEAYDGVLHPLILNELNKRGFKDMRDKYCFIGSLEELKETNFPVLLFEFAEGASLQLDEDSLFIDHDLLNYFCLTVRSSAIYGPTIQNLTIIGLTAQQDYIIGYDLENLRLSMTLYKF